MIFQLAMFDFQRVPTFLQLPMLGIPESAFEKRHPVGGAAHGCRRLW